MAKRTFVSRSHLSAAAAPSFPVDFADGNWAIIAPFLDATLPVSEVTKCNGSEAVRPVGITKEILRISFGQP